jgi:hypothetical protein
MRFTYIKNLLNLTVSCIKGGIYFTYRIYKKNNERQSKHAALKYASACRFAIVMQGPVIVDDDFTASTLRQYRNYFPNAILILSTWPVSSGFVESLQKYDVNIIQNKLPKNSGIANINLQIVTSSAGVLAAKELGAQYVLKTRTDQRIYHPGLDTYLGCLLESFPLSANIAGQAHRLVGVSLDTLKYRLYGISDMFLYGHIDDMIRYWNIQQDKRKDLTVNLNNSVVTWRKASAMCLGQVYLCSEYLKNVKHDLSWTLKDSFTVFKDRFVIIDQAAIRLYWHKYTLNEDRYTQFGFYDPELSFNDWLSLYRSIDRLIVDENILDEKMIVEI